MNGLSPVKKPTETGGLDYGDALRDVARGLKLRRRGWVEGKYLFLRAELLHIRIPQGDGDLVPGEHKNVPCLDDLLANDWEVAR
jgi:hypothetical protein